MRVKVVPASSRNGVAGWLGDTLKICVSAPPERGKANAAVTQVLAEALGIEQDEVRVIQGMTSPRKLIEIVGVSEAEVHRRLAKGVAS